MTVPPNYYRDAPLIRQVANDVKNGIASPLAAAMLDSMANFVEAAQGGYRDVVIDELIGPQTPNPQTGEVK